MTTRSSAGQVPTGVADYFWGEAYARRRLEATLLGAFRQWGYGDVVTPAFEYADTLSARGNRELQSELCRFLDRDGSMLALRADHWLHQHPDAPAALANEIRQQMMQAFYTDTDAWRGQIVSQARQALHQAVLGLSAAQGTA